MANLPNSEIPVLDRGDDFHMPEPKPLRRKLVQSTLFPCKSQVNCNDKSGGVIGVEDCDDDDDEEWCGSQRKKKTKQRRKGKSTTAPRSRSFRKDNQVHVTPKKKGASNGHLGLSSRHCSAIEIEDVLSSAVPSQKLEAQLVQTILFPCKSQEVEADCNGDKKSAEDKDSADEECYGSQKSRKRKGKTTPQTRTSQKSKEWQLNTTPKKNKTSNGHAGTSSGQSSPVVIEDALPPPIPNLRLEAKLMAEEASRIYSGKQIHPFFTPRRVGKKSHEASEVENSWSAVDPSDKHTNIGPIHVFESPQINYASFNWRDWNFFEETHTSSRHYAEGSFSSIFKGSVKAICFDKLLKGSYTSSLTHSLNKPSLKYQVIQNGHPHQTSTITANVADDKGSLNNLSHNLEAENGADGVHCFPRDACKSEKSEIALKRMMSHYTSCKNQPADSLWTDKFQPRNAEEVCGNTESVKLLNEWLHLWHEVDIRSCRNSKDYDERMKYDDSDYYINDCDSEDINEEGNLKNVLVIKGPTGSGKTAAIYACAKEQGFRVLEANASECRNGAVLKHKFGEALLSFWRSRSTKISVDSKSKLDKKLSSARHKKIMTDPEEEVTEVIPLSDEEDFHVETSEEMVYELDNAHNQGELKPLILFEDVDIVFPEDRGFLSAIQEISETAKGPVILTSSIENPVLPDNMDRLEVCFKALPPKELLHYAHKICMSEKARIHPHLLEKLIECCDGDIRKTIMSLQYFCHKGKDDQGEYLQWSCDPLRFDLATGHQIFPIILPWNLPSQLSELVEKEISESISRLTKQSTLPAGFDEESNKDATESMEMHNSVLDSIQAKKEEMLSRNFSANDCNVLATLLDDAEELSNSSGTPVAFSRRNARKKSDTIMSSDSDDECFKGVCPVVSSWDSDDEFFPEVDCKVPSPQGATQNFLSPSASDNLLKEASNPDVQMYPVTEAVTELDFNDTSMLFDESCVPESSFVPETVDEAGQVSNTVSCGHVANTMEESMNNEIKSVLSIAKADSIDQFPPILHQNIDTLRHAFHVNLDHSDRKYVEDSHGNVEAIPKFIVMDECSRIDFSKKSKFVERLKPSTTSDLVQESWNNLRNCCPDLEQLVATENKDASRILKLAYEATKLISEADILLSNCYLLRHDSFESSTALSEVSDVFSWCNQQLHMTSTFLQHGFGCYMEDVSSLGSIGECQPENYLSCDVSAASTTKKGDIDPEDSEACKTSPTGPGMIRSLKSEMYSCLDVIHSVVPSRSYLTLRGTAFHEYLSSLCHISRSEASRITEVSGKLRRGRSARHYLSTGSLMLTPEDISSLDQCSYYGKSSSQATDANINYNNL